MDSHISEFTSILLVEEIFTDVFRIPSGCKGLVEQEGTKADAYKPQNPRQAILHELSW